MFVKRALSTAPVNYDIGLLVIRVGIGLSLMIFHGYGKLTGGVESWTWLGGNMANLGLGFAPAFWGFCAMFAEFFCPILLILGVLFRPAALLIVFNMVVAITMHLNLPEDSPNAGWSGASHALEFLIVYLGLFLTGPGRYAFKLIGKHHLNHRD